VVVPFIRGTDGPGCKHMRSGCRPWRVQTASHSGRRYTSKKLERRVWIVDATRYRYGLIQVVLGAEGLQEWEKTFVEYIPRVLPPKSDYLMEPSCTNEREGGCGMPTRFGPTCPISSVVVRRTATVENEQKHESLSSWHWALPWRLHRDARGPTFSPLIPLTGISLVSYCVLLDDHLGWCNSQCCFIFCYDWKTIPVLNPVYFCTF
jgi:hypothetical protein